MAIACLGTGTIEIIKLGISTLTSITYEGCNHNIIGNPLEREGHDRADINLPGSQLQLLQDAARSASGEINLFLMCSVASCTITAIIQCYT